MSIQFKRATTIGLIAAMFMQGIAPVTAAFAVTTEAAEDGGAQEHSFVQNEDGTVTIIDAGVQYTIEIIEDGNIRTAFITNDLTKEVDSITYNENTNQMWSSITGVSWTTEVVPLEVSSSSEIQPYANQPVRTYTRYNFSWNELRNAAGAGAGVAGVVAYIGSRIGMVGVAGLATGVAAVLGLFGGVIPDNQSGGIYVITVLKRWYDDDGVLYQTQAGIDEVGLY